MKKWKYFFIKDSKAEAIGYIEADDYLEAIKLASEKKQLDRESFIKIFDVDEVE